MKKNYALPSLKIELFNKELILQASAVPEVTNEGAATAALNGVDGMKKVAVITL